MKTLAPNTMIQNRYLVVHAIGKGGMGEVYLAVDQRLGSAVALKRTFFKDDSALGSAFEREARILARLRHPVLPKVIDHFAENGDQYLVMEHISGDDLSKRLENNQKPFPLSWVMFWADQMLDALTYLHSHEPPIIHRDIKPQNLKLTDENHIVILDFGLSKDFDTKTTGNPLNSASVAGYSPHFASMEQIRGTGTDARSDIYSLSATLYQLITNVIPSDALTRADALLGGLPDPIVLPSELNPEVPKAISEVLLLGIALRQEQRFSSAVEMQKALRRAFNNGDPAIDPSTKDLSNVSTIGMKAANISRPEAAETSSFRLEKTLGMDEKTAEQLMQADIKTAIYSKPPSPEPDSLVSQAQPPLDLSEETVETRISSPRIGVPDGMASTPQAIIDTQPPQDPPPPTTTQESPMPDAEPAVTAVNSAAAAATVSAQQALPTKSSKMGLIVGILIGLVLLAGAVGGAGWFAYTKYVAVSDSPASTPTPLPAVTPAPVATEAVVADSGQNVNSNSSSAELNNSNVEVPVSNKATTSPAAPPLAGKPTPPQTVTAKETSPRTAPTPGAKATPKAKPRDERTVILQ